MPYVNINTYSIDEAVAKQLKANETRIIVKS